MQNNIDLALSDKLCLICYKVLKDKRNTVCSTACRKKRHLHKFPKNKCLFCEDQVKTHRNTFCSTTCKLKYENKIYLEQFKLGLHLSDFLVKKILLSICPQCSICGIDTWDNKPINLELDHINGDCTNNLEHNVRLLCPNCHSQTPTYKGKNLGKSGRKDRKKYPNYRNSKHKDTSSTIQCP